MIELKPLLNVGQLQQGNLLIIETTAGIPIPAEVKEARNSGRISEQVVLSKTQGLTFLTDDYLKKESKFTDIKIVLNGRNTSLSSTSRAYRNCL